MDIFSGVILGAVQGITEFLPISSSGHLIIVRELFGFSLVGSLTFDVMLHVATLLSVLIYFWRDITDLLKILFNYLKRQPVKKKDKTLLGALVVGTVPAGLLGFFFEGYIELFFRDPAFIAWALIAGSAVFLIAERLATQLEKITIFRGLVVGLFQALALIPGMSRSGSSISGGLLMGLTREEAARFSFLLAVPVILGAGIKKVFELSLSEFVAQFGMPLAAGSLTAFIVGLLSVHFLMRFLKNHTLNVFVVYRVVLAVLVFVFLI